MSVINSIPLIAAGDDGYQISRSVRLRSSASATFSRTPASASNRRTWSWSAWVKRGSLAGNFGLFSAKQTKDDITGVYLNSSDKLVFLERPSNSTNAILITTMVFRDPSAWYHIMVVVDSTQATNTNRIKFFVNGVQTTQHDSATYPSQNYEFTYINNAQDHRIGAFQDNTAQNFDGYLTEINFIDGQALTPSSFGETDTITGVWKPKRYAGTYGTNGFYLNFSDNSAATAAAIGKDSSGNGNNWTPNNISVTSGVTYDSMLDVPTLWADGGNGRGNYAVLNPLDVSPTESSGRASISDGNLTATGGNQFARGWQIPSSGQWYWEITLVDYYNGAPPFIWGQHGVSSGLTGNTTGIKLWADTSGGIMQDGTKVQTFSTWANNDVIGFAYDAATRSMSVYRNGTQLGTSVTANATDKYVYSYLNGTADTSSVAYNFGQRPFAYTPPTGFKALNTQNLPEATIKKGGDYFNAVTYTGNSGSQTVSNGVFQPDLTWHKTRSAAASHVLFDSIRGASSGLNSDSTAAQNTNWTGQSFTSTGFTVSNAYSSESNYNGQTMVAWQWKESVSAGFDIVTYTGTGGGSVRTIAHNLGVAPAMIISKCRGTAVFGTDSWVVYSKGFAVNDYIFLNSTGAKGNSANYLPALPTSSVFSVGGTSANVNNESGLGYVAYCFAEVAGFSKFGSYTGNGSTDGPFVFTNMKPRFVMIKRTDSTSNWYIFDTARDTYNVMKTELLANSSNADADNTRWIDCLSNGFKIRNDNVSQINASGGTFIYAAFAENPFRYSLAR